MNASTMVVWSNSNKPNHGIGLLLQFLMHNVDTSLLLDLAMLFCFSFIYMLHEFDVDYKVSLKFFNY